ncbi:beta-1,4-galactosyltransferase galt-1-like [Lineus longissimus]|uniref:beta-1,4-galactosyltransferase galt-1-like n=1 Tax=Lineus longissimus TaxID=88925 RepID=UPI00315D1DAD
MRIRIGFTLRYFIFAVVVFSFVDIMMLANGPGPWENINLKMKRNSNGCSTIRTSNAKTGDALYNSNFSSLECAEGQSVYLHTAFLDKRARGKPIVRILAVLESDDLPELECAFRLDNGTVLQVDVEYYEMCENHRRQYGSFMLLCPIPVRFYTPCSVTVEHARSNGTGAHRVVLPLRMLTGTGSQEKKHKFGVCVPPIHGNVQKQKLVEFIELTLLLGAEKIIFYDYKATDAVRDVLRYYVKRDKVSLEPWPLPSSVDPEAKRFFLPGIWYHGQSLAINDCLYKYSNDFKYLSFNDIDEFIIPKHQNTWEELIKSQYKDAHAGYCFNSAYFDTTLRNNHGGILISQRFTTRAKPDSQKRRKCIVRPERVVEMGIHHITVAFTSVRSCEKISRPPSGD